MLQEFPGSPISMLSEEFNYLSAVKRTTTSTESRQLREGELIKAQHTLLLGTASNSSYNKTTAHVVSSSLIGKIM